MLTDRPGFADLLDEICICVDCELRPGRAEIYWRGLQEFSFSVVQEAARELQRTCPKFPPLALWAERCKAIATRRARAAAPARERAEHSAPATWATTAELAILRAALRGLSVSDPAMRERALELALAELIELREEHNAPASVPRARLTAEQDRIARVLVRQLAGETSATEPAT